MFSGRFELSRLHPSRLALCGVVGVGLVLGVLAAYLIWADRQMAGEIERARYYQRLQGALEEVADQTDRAELLGVVLFFEPTESRLAAFESAVGEIYARYDESLAAATRREDHERIAALYAVHRDLADRYLQVSRAAVRGEPLPQNLPTSAESSALLEQFAALVGEYRQRADEAVSAVSATHSRMRVGQALSYAIAALAVAGLVMLVRAAGKREGRMTAELESLRSLAVADPLTGLGNLRALQTSLAEAAAPREDASVELVLAMVDVDHLREVNDLFGPGAGDLALKTVAGVLRSGVRPGHRVFRVGGDEFAILMPDTSPASARFLLERLRAACDKELDGTTVSIGFASLDPVTRDTSLLQEQAYAALAEAKRRGRNLVFGYDAGTAGPVTAAAKGAELRRLLNQGGLRAVFQPIWELGSGRLLAFEALTRLPPDFDIRGPFEAFEIAERIGRAHELDMHCRHAIIASAGSLPDGIALFVNVSPYTLSHQQPCPCVADKGPFNTWADALAEEFRSGGIEPSSVVLEVTERSTIPAEFLAARVRELRAAGFRIALDDVGAGNAGLEMLRLLEVDYVKVDRGVLLSAMESAKGRAAFAAIVAFAAVSGARVIAEGVEDEAMLELVRRGGLTDGQRSFVVHGVQGYLLGKPGELETCLAQQRRIQAA